MRRGFRTRRKEDEDRMHGVVVALMVMWSVGQPPKDWWRLTDSVEFRWDDLSGSGVGRKSVRLHNALVLASVQACDEAVKNIDAVKGKLRDGVEDAWVKVAWVYVRCMRWTQAYQAMRRSALALSKWPTWAKWDAGAAFLARGRPWDAFKVWSDLMLDRRGKSDYFKIFAALAALEMGKPEKSLTVLSAVPVTVVEGSDASIVVWARILRGLALLVEGRQSRARMFLQAAMALDPGLGTLSRERALLVGCFDPGLVASFLQQAAGCNVAARLRARAAAYRRGRRGVTGRDERIVDRKNQSVQRGQKQALRSCAIFAPSLEAAAAWRADKATARSCRAMEEIVAGWSSNRP